MEDDFQERFLKANANPDYISSRFADVVRNLVRAFSATDPTRPLFLASEEMKHVSELLQRSEEPISWYYLFSHAIDEIHKNFPRDDYDVDYIRAAQAGAKYLAESSATDNAARGRASRRLSEFLSMIEHSREARKIQNK